MYGGGESEEILGRALAEFAQRDNDVIATKIFYPVRSGPNGRGLSRKAIFAGIDGSAGARNVPRAQVALAWLMQQRDVTAPIVGATKLGHLDDAVEAMRLKLDPSEIELLGRHYVPHAMSFAE